MKMKVILLILVGCMFTSAESACQCSDVTLQDARDGEIGRCESKLGGQFWCYVSSNSECTDKKESSRQAGLFWSHKACSENKDTSRDSRTRNSVCVTVGGDDTGATCVFPFIYHGKSYEGCTLENADDGIPWCSTQVDGEGVHVGKQGKWGQCGQGCPTDLGNDISAVDSACECSDVTLQDDTDGEIGGCKSKLGGKFWCYVSSNSGCSDKKESSRQADLFWSHKACGMKVSSGQNTIRGNDITAVDSECDCSDVTLQDDTDGEIGRCESKLGGKFWCYVSSNSGCSDKKESSRQADLFWSHLACSKKPDTRLGITKGVENSCRTVGGDDVGAACVFLFIHKDKFYTGCTLDGAKDGKPWCSTQVDAQGVHASGQGKWGHCGQGCPIDSGTSVNSLVQEPALNNAKSPILRSANCVLEGYWRYWEYGVEYPGNDIRPCRLNKKSSAAECQRFCQTVPGCVGWEWGYDGNNCCAKSAMKNRGTAIPVFPNGRIAGLANSCEPAVSTGDCFTSPGYPNSYPNSASVRHVMRVPAGQKIEVTFKYFDIEDHRTCGYDYLQLYDKLFNAISIKFCGIASKFTKGKLELSTSLATAVFQTDRSVTGKGFNICYKPVDVPSSSDCLTSPGHPKDYPDGFHKIETLTVAAGKHIEITFHHFDVEAQSTCRYDYLQFVGESEKLCGNTLPEKMTIASNTARVLFHTDGSVRRKGYKFCYKPVTPATSVCGIENPGNRISGGTETRANQYPWMVRLAIKLSDGRVSGCGGALLTDRHVLTAKHCVDFDINKAESKVKVSVHDQSDASDYQEVGVKEFVWPDTGAEKHDIAIIVLATSVDLTDRTIGTVCLPANEDEDYRGKSAMAMGWGWTPDTSSQSRLLQHVKQKVDQRQQKYWLYTDVDFSNGIPLDVCRGDSGGPLVYKKEGKWTVIGTVSSGAWCDRHDGTDDGRLGKWNKVTGHLTWIKNIMATT